LLRRSSGATEIASLNATGAYALVGVINNGASSVNITFKLATGSGRVPLGTYTNTFTVQLFTGTQTPPGGVPDAIGTVLVNLDATQNNAMTMSLSDNGICDFGSMVEGRSYNQTLTLSVTSPATYSISALSKNGGRLILSIGESIGYNLYFNGSSTATDLSNGTVKLVTSTTNATNRLYTLEFVTEVLTFAEAGQYTDSLYLMFTTG
jgi:hypothetical protein